MEFRKICPICFSERGYSVELEERDNLLLCPYDKSHVFRQDEKGLLVKTRIF